MVHEVTPSTVFVTFEPVAFALAQQDTSLRIERLIQKTAQLFSGKKILIVEDDDFLDEETHKMLEASGAIVLGPVGSIEDGLSLMDREEIDAAILDISIEGEAVFLIAERLLARNIPFIFAAAYVDPALQGRYGGYQLCARPLELRQIAMALFGSRAPVDGGLHS